tara:strand:- start:12 stop:335 length:324 start_codon:yes stop_codon:yes gene_type:complete
MKKLIELKNGTFQPAIIKGIETITLTPVKKDSDEYNKNLVDGYKLLVIPKSEKDAYEAQQAQDAINQEAMKYLDDTDKFFTRFGETGKAMPKGMAKARAEARERIKV